MSINQQPLSNSEIRDLCFKIAKLLKDEDVKEEAIINTIKEAVVAKLIEESLNQYILVPKYKGI
jgi:hypothetical protein